jgi:hypothetical protein
MAEQPDQIGRGEHTSVSPHTNLDIALANFDIIILTQQSPIDWLNASKSHVLACVRGFTPGFTEKQRDECIGLIRDFPSYTVGCLSRFIRTLLTFALTALYRSHLYACYTV